MNKILGDKELKRKKMKENWKKFRKKGSLFPQKNRKKKRQIIQCRKERCRNKERNNGRMGGDCRVKLAFWLADRCSMESNIQQPFTLLSSGTASFLHSQP